MSDDAKNPFGEKTFVMTKEEPTPPPAPQSGDKTVVYAKSNLQETFDARTVVRSSKPAPATLPSEAPPKVIPVELPPPVTAAPAPAVSIADADTSLPVAEKVKLSKTERRVAREALDRKTRSYMMGFGAVCVIAVAVIVATLSGSGKPSDKSAVASVEGPGPKSGGTKAELASESDAPPSKTAGRDANMLGAYKSTTDVLKDFDRAAKKAQDHSIGF